MIVAILVFGIAAISLLSLILGAYPCSLAQVARVFGAEFGLTQAVADDALARSILLFIRLPRIVAALVAGASLALAGAAMQGLLRNPLAGPDILGVSAGGSLGAVIALTVGLGSVSGAMIPAAAFAGAFAVSLAIAALGRRSGKTQLLYVILAGLAVSSFINGLISMILLFANQYQIQMFVLWTMGGLEGRQWSDLAWPCLFAVPAFVVLFMHNRQLNLLGLGEEEAHASGLNVERSKLLMLSACALATATAITIAGPIGFIGLLIPHGMRLVAGSDHRILLPASALAGALFLEFADLVGRVVLVPAEIKAGIITALVGSPLFIARILSMRRDTGRQR